MKSFNIYNPVYYEPSRLSSAVFVILCVLPMLTTLLYGGVDTISLGALSVFAAIIFCLWVADSWHTGELRFNSNLIQLPIIALLLLGLIQLLPLGDPGVPSGLLNVPANSSISMDPFATRYFVIRLFVCLIFLLAAFAFIDSDKRAKRISYSIIIFGSVLAFFGILQRLANPEGIYGIRPTPQAIPFGPFINQHHFAAMMEMTSGLVLGLLLGGGLKRDRKAFLLIAAILMSVALISTGSRGGVISFAGIIAFVTAATYFFPIKKGRERLPRDERPRVRRFAMIAGSGAIMLLIVGLVFYLGAGDSLLRGFGFQEQYVDVSSGRIHFWKTAIAIFLSHPILGVGLDGFGAAFTRFDTQSGAFRIEQAHNDYLQMLSDGGIIGFACIAIFVFLLFRNGIRTIAARTEPLMRSIAIGSLAGCFGIAIHSFFDFPLRTPSNALFFLLLVVLATSGSFGEGHKKLAD